MKCAGDGHFCSIFQHLFHCVFLNLLGLKDPVLVRLDVDSKLSQQLKVSLGMGTANPFIATYTGMVRTTQLLIAKPSPDLKAQTFIRAKSNVFVVLVLESYLTSILGRPLARRLATFQGTQYIHVYIQTNHEIIDCV